MTTAPSKENPSAKAQIRAWVKREGDNQKELSLPKLADKGVEHFSQQPALVKELFGQSLRSILYSTVLAVYHDTRLMKGDMLIPVDRQKPGAETPSKWALWLEQVGRGVPHKRLWDMTRADLEKAADIRLERSLHEEQLARIWRKLAEGMETDTETVGQRYTHDEIEAIREQVAPSSTDSEEAQ